MKAWYLITTKLKSELKTKNNLMNYSGVETFFPVFPTRRKNSPIGLPLFPRYVFVYFNLQQDFTKVKFTPGVGKIVSFGATFIPIPDDVIHCLKSRCDKYDVLLEEDASEGKKVRVREGIFEGCQGIIKEKRGNLRVQLLLELAFGTVLTVEMPVADVEPSA